MPVENDFLPFAVGTGANVESQSQYAANTSLLQGGFTSGLAPSVQLNKVWRQSSIMAAVLAAFIVQETGQPAIDDGTTATLLANFTSAVQVAATGRLLNIQIFTSSGTYTPTPGANTAIVEIVGGGGGSGGTTAQASGSGALSQSASSGSYAKVRITSGLAATAVTIGASGTAGTSTTSGGTGGTSSFGTLVSCPGGKLGVNGSGSTVVAVVIGAFSPAAPTITGANVQAIISQQGTQGLTGIAEGSGLLGVGGPGGGTPFGPGGSGGTSGSGNVANVPSYGAGAGGSYMGASGPLTLGAAGGAGIVIVSEYA